MKRGDFYMETRVNMTVRIEENFDELIAKLKPLQFQLTAQGELTWENPYESHQKLTIKPLVEGSRNYSVNFIGSYAFASTVLKRALEYFKTEVRQLHFNVYLKNYSILDCWEKAATHWKETHSRIFDCHTEDFKDLACLLMDDKIMFQTRSVKTLDRVSQAIHLCEKLSEVFQVTQAFDLFTFEMFAPEYTSKESRACYA